MPPLTTTDHVAVDFEVYHDKEVTIKTLGTWHYLQHPKAEIFLVSIYDAINGLWVGHPKDFEWSSISGRHWVSHNRSFDHQVYERLEELGVVELGCGPKLWDCTADLTIWCRCKRALKDAALHLLGRKIDKNVRSLMKGLAPEQMRELVMAENGKLYPISGFAANVQNDIRAIDPDDRFDHSFYGDVCRYAGDDAKDSWEIFARYANTWPETERRVSRLTGKQGKTGIKMNAEKLEEDIFWLDNACAYAKSQLPWGNDLPTDEGVLSLTKLKEHIIGLNLTPPSTTSEDSEECREFERQNPEVTAIRFMRDFRKANILRRRAQHILSHLMPKNGRLPFAWTYGGAHTLRWAGGSDAKKGGTGETGFNVQNMAKESVWICKKTGEVISADGRHNNNVDKKNKKKPEFNEEDHHEVNLRARCITEPGKKWICGDAEQIEARITLWVAGDDEALAKVKSGMSIYEVHARKAMSWKGGNLKKEDPDQYFMAKNRVLALGFGCGKVKFHDRCRELGFPITMKDSANQVSEYRAKERLIKKLWYKLSNDINGVARRNMLRLKGVLKDLPEGELENYEYVLPSGRSLIWFAPVFQTSNKDPAAREAEKELAKLKGIKRQAANNNVMARTELGGRIRFWYGGKILENIAQAIARDVLCHMMLCLDDRGIDMLFSVHDEEDLEVDQEITCAQVKSIMEDNPPEWAEGLPISVEVKEAAYYFK